MPSLLHSRGLLAGAGSAASLIGAALVSLLFATGLVAFTSWPTADSSSTPSVNLPSAPTAGGGVPTGAAGRGAAVTTEPAIVLPAAGAPSRRGTARQIGRTGGRGGSTAVPVGSPQPAVPSPSGSAPSAPGAPAPRNVTDDVADTTQATTHTVATTVGGPVGGAADTTGGQVAQTVRDVGDAAQPLLGILGG